jgi:uncharacterized protein (DUF2141 family)
MRPSILRRLGAALAATTLALAARAVPAEAADLTIVVTGAATRGEIRAKVFDDAVSFAAKSNGIASFTAQPGAGVSKASATFHDLPPGRYAIAAFQDINGNGALDTNLFGIPSEPYGLSNDASAFDAAAVTLGRESLTATIILR